MVQLLMTTILMRINSNSFCVIKIHWYCSWKSYQRHLQQAYLALQQNISVKVQLMMDPLTQFCN